MSFSRFCDLLGNDICLTELVYSDDNDVRAKLGLFSSPSSRCRCSASAHRDIAGLSVPFQARFKECCFQREWTDIPGDRFDSMSGRVIEWKSDTSSASGVSLDVLLSVNHK